MKRFKTYKPWTRSTKETPVLLSALHNPRGNTLKTFCLLGNKNQYLNVNSSQNFLGALFPLSIITAARPSCKCNPVSNSAPTLRLQAPSLVWSCLPSLLTPKYTFKKKRKPWGKKKKFAFREEFSIKCFGTPWNNCIVQIKPWMHCMLTLHTQKVPPHFCSDKTESSHKDQKISDTKGCLTTIKQSTFYLSRCSCIANENGWGLAQQN